jgi:thioester reductase-like protein
MNILISGAGGFLGTHLLPLLCGQGHKIFLICRSSSIDKIKNKFHSFLKELTIMEGDLTDPEIFLHFEDSKKILETVDCVIHAAARYDLEASRADSFIHNVVGTQNMLHLVSKTKKNIDFHYISTIAVVGDHEGIFFENELNKQQHFYNSYASTKFEAELAVRKHEHLFESLTVHRLGILVGDSKRGEFEKVDGPYYFLRSLARLDSKIDLGKLKKIPFPFSPSASFPIIPVDYAARFIAKTVLSNNSEKLRCFHVVGKNPPKLKTFVDDAFEYLGLKIKVYPLPKNPLNKIIFKTVQLPVELMEHAYSKVSYDRSQVENLKGFDLEDISYQEFKDIFFTSAYKTFKKKREV